MPSPFMASYAENRRGAARRWSRELGVGGAPGSALWAPRIPVSRDTEMTCASPGRRGARRGPVSSWLHGQLQRWLDSTDARPHVSHTRQRHSRDHRSALVRPGKRRVHSACRIAAGCARAAAAAQPQAHRPAPVDVSTSRVGQAAGAPLSRVQASRPPNLQRFTTSAAPRSRASDPGDPGARADAR
jgi:hypothetical protein